MIEEVDVVVVGSGAAGLTASIVAASAGLRVVVLEKTCLVGGTSAYSGGAAWVPVNHLMLLAGAIDQAEKAKAYIRAIVGNTMDEDLVDAFLESCVDAFRFLEENTSAVRFSSPDMVDYFPALPGAMSHRTLMPLVFDGSVLGDHFHKLRPNLSQFMIMHSMQVDGTDVLHLQRALYSRRSFLYSIKLLARYVGARLVRGRGTRLVRGNALMGRLYKSAVDANVEVRLNSSATRLICHDGRVSGVAFHHEGQEIELTARLGVVLASGGWSANESMRRRLMPFADEHLSMLPDGNVGDGLRMAEEVGGSLGAQKASNGILAPVSVMRSEGERLVKYPYFSFERGKPGMMIVDELGNRFTNDAACYHDVVRAMQSQGKIPVWLIADRRTLRKYGMGIARPAPYRTAPLVRAGHLFEADSLAGLARQIGVDPRGLEETGRRMNRFASSGVDEDFGRGADSYSRSTGDASHTPNPCLGPISEPPFYAVKLYPGDVGTTLGLKINCDAQVLSASGQAIVGLYACGLDADSIFGGHYPGAGSMHGPNMTFAYRCAKHIVASAKA